MAAGESHQELVPQQHILLQDLDVGLGLPQRIDPAGQMLGFMDEIGMNRDKGQAMGGNCQQWMGMLWRRRRDSFSAWILWQGLR